MENAYTCVCASKTWFVLEQSVRCTVCNKTFPVQMTPVDEFNRAVAEEVEVAEEAL